MNNFESAGLVKLTLCASLAVALAACGGGGSGGNSANAGAPASAPGNSKAPITGKAIDGYLVGATVCFDNGQGACDTTQPSTTTDANGNYSLTPNGNVVGRQLLVSVSPTTKDLSRPGYTFPASFTLSGIVTDQTAQALVTPISTMVVAMMQSGMTQSAATAAVSSLLGEPVNLTTDYVAANDTTASTFATNVVNTVTSFGTGGATSASTVRAVLQAMVASNTTTPSQAQVTAQASQPVYLPADAAQVLASPTYSLDGYLYDWVNGPKTGTNQQAPVQTVHQLANDVFTSTQQEFVNNAWSTPDIRKYNQMIGAYELKAGRVRVLSVCTALAVQHAAALRRRPHAHRHRSRYGYRVHL